MRRHASDLAWRPIIKGDNIGDEIVVVIGDNVEDDVRLELPMQLSMIDNDCGRRWRHRRDRGRNGE